MMPKEFPAIDPRRDMAFITLLNLIFIFGLAALLQPSTKPYPLPPPKPPNQHTPVLKNNRPMKSRPRVLKGI